MINAIFLQVVISFLFRCAIFVLLHKLVEVHAKCFTVEQISLFENPVMK